VHTHPEHVRKLPRYTQAQLTRETDELGRAFYKSPEGLRVCGRFKKRHNRQIEDEACLAPPTAIGPCRVHGGKSPGGRMRSGGRYSRVLKRWRRPFERALADQELLDTRRELAMMDVLIERLTVRAERGDSPEWRAELVEEYTLLDDAVRGMRHAEVGQRLKALGESIRRGSSGDQARGELMDQLERRSRCSARLSDLELRREQRLTEGEVAAQLGAFLGVLQRVLEPQVLHRLMPELEAVLPVPARVVPARQIEAPEDP